MTKYVYTPKYAFTSKYSQGDTSRTSRSSANLSGKGIKLHLEEEADGKLADGCGVATEHKTCKVPPGRYEVTYADNITRYYGSDYCWYSTSKGAVIRSVNRPDLTYYVTYFKGGDGEQFEKGYLVDEAYEAQQIEADVED